MLYYIWITDYILPTTINDISVLQTKAIASTNNFESILIVYLYMSQCTRLILYKSNLILKCYLNRSYLSAIDTRSRVV